MVRSPMLEQGCSSSVQVRVRLLRGTGVLVPGGDVRVAQSLARVSAGR